MHIGVKGQAELVAVIAFVILGVVAAYFVMQPHNFSGQPSGFGTNDESKLIRDAITNLIRKGALENIDKAYDNGGYIDASKVTNVEYGGLNVPVWQACSNSMAPDVERELAAAISDYVAENLEKSSDFYGKDVKIETNRLSTRVKILDGRVDVEVNLPATVNGNALSQTYKTSVPANLYEIINFAKDFTKDSDTYNIFESATLASMARSNPETDAWMPLAGSVSECGRRIVRTREELLSAMKLIIGYTMSHIIWNGEQFNVDDNIFFNINGAGGKPYSDINAEFSYPPSWDSELERKFTSTPQTLNIAARPVMPTVPVCMGPYYVKYSFQYPVIVSVKDEITGKYFRFAILVSVKDNKPDDTCTADVFSGTTDYEEECITNAKCDFNITVKDSSGNPIEGADVMFYECSLGKTDENGNIMSTDSLKIPCIMSDLQVYKEGYRTYGKFISAMLLDGLDVTLVKGAGAYTINIYGVPVKAIGKTGEGEFTTYEVTGTKMPITGFKKAGSSDIRTIIDFYPEDPNAVTGEDFEIVVYNTDDDQNIIGSIEQEGLYPGTFAVGAVAMENSTQKVVGIINTTLTINEGDDTIFVYLPIVNETDGGALDASINQSQSSKMANLASCFGAAGVISTSELSDVTKGCAF
ncbi:MAG: hypothetical protein GXO64_00845 [Candidatus Micrarchaeota archaeon]|nr:hypothetical protein [Candidatus Micrarchaeota archaeon]